MSLKERFIYQNIDVKIVYQFKSVFNPILRQWNKFKVIRRQLPNFYPNNVYFFTNNLDIETQSLSINYINPTNQNRLNLIMKLHNEGWSNKRIVTFLNLNGIERRNKKDDYKVKDIFMCLQKLKIREKRKSNIKYKLRKWEL